MRPFSFKIRQGNDSNDSKSCYLVIEFCSSGMGGSCSLFLTDICDNCLLTRDVNLTESVFRTVSVQGSVNVTLRERYSAKAIMFFCSKLHLDKVLHLGLQHNKQSVLLKKKYSEVIFF